MPPRALAAWQNYRLLASSPYSASCTTGCDFKATDGKDLGADIDLVETATSGATTGASAAVRLGLRIDPGSRYAIVRYNAPTAAACSLTLFTDLARTQPHADTATAGTQLDSRAGSLSAGRRREFVLGTVSLLSAATVYNARLDCGTIRVPFVVRTQAAGSTVTHELRLPAAREVRYASNPAHTGAVTLPAATRQLVPVPTASVVYIQIGSQSPWAVTGR